MKTFRCKASQIFQLSILLGLVLGQFFAAETRAASCLSGFVRDTNGNPVPAVDLDFFDAATGVKVVTPRDNTDIAGFYNVCVLPGVYKVTFAPSARNRTHLMGTVFPVIDLSDNNPKELDVVLASGIVVTGLVSDSLGQPIGDVDLDFDRLSGGRVYTGDDNSDPITGIYWVVVPPGDYRVRYEPLSETTWRGWEFDSVKVTKDTTINVILHRGVTLTGSVKDTLGKGIGDVDIELKVESTGEKVFVVNNTTDTSGNYHVIVPKGTFELRFVPQMGVPLIGQSRLNFQIDRDTTWSSVLLPGYLVTANVSDPGAIPLNNVDLDFNIPGTGLKLFTPHDKTDPAGVSIVAVPPGIYDIELDPPSGAPYDRLTAFDVHIGRDTTMYFTMPEVTRVRVTGKVVDGDSIGLPDVTINMYNVVTGAKIYIPDNHTGPAGDFNLDVPPGMFDMFFAPPFGSHFVGLKQANVEISRDTVLGPTVLDSGLVVVCKVVDQDSAVVRSADIDFIKETNGITVYTPFDETDLAGSTAVAVTPGIYTVRVNPPAGSAFLAGGKTGLNLQRDTSLTFMLTKPAVQTGEEVILYPNYPNPFGDETAIPYYLAVGMDASIKVFSVAGELVRTLSDKLHPAGAYQVTWDGKNDRGNQVASGVYIYQLNTTNGVKTRKMMLIQ